MEAVSAPKELDRDVMGCGCIRIEFTDGRKEFAPCVPHGLADVADSLGRASRALAAVVSTMVREVNEERAEGGLEPIQWKQQTG